MLAITHLNVDKTVSITDMATGEVRHYNIDILPASVPILGILRNEVGLIYKVVPIKADDVSKEFVPIINLIKTPEIKEFANYFRRLVPEHFFTAPASVGGKHHPPCNIGEGGLMRHTVFVCSMFQYITEIESTVLVHGYTQRELDLMLVACMFHDFLKDGWEFDVDAYNTHAKSAANAFLSQRGLLPDNDLLFIAHCIESHMGQWSNPKPADKYQWLVHLCDYLASRNSINMIFGKTMYRRGDEVVIDVSQAKSGLPGGVASIQRNKTSSKKSNTAKTKIEDPEIIKALEQFITYPVVNNVVKEKLEITRSDAEIYDIAKTLYNTKEYSEKQAKYVKLICASVMCKKN